MALGLQAAHDADVIHRDLKPANVMVEGGDVNGRIVLTDFGVARALDGEGKRTSGTLGTPIYMAPEQLLGEPTTAASDIYSLGMILYEMVTGTLPFDGETPMAIALARCRVPPVDPREHADVSAHIAEVILRCLHLDPGSRPGSALELAEALAKLASAASAQTVMVPSSLSSSGTMASRSSTAPSISRPFAPMSPGKRTLAVLPFQYRGTPELDYLGESLAQELIDTLSRTRGLRVLGYGATSAYASRSHDARVIGQELGADAIVGASVQATSSRVRVSARLTDVQSGVQIWSERFDKPFEDVFEMQDVVCKRVANALRVELSLIEHEWHASAEAADLYLRARRLTKAKNFMGGAEAVRLLERCIELSPRFTPAIAARAIAAVQAWWADIVSSSDTNYNELSRAYVEEALEAADDLAETHLAAAMYGLQMGDLPRTATELATTLTIAPTLPDAHRYLAELQCEAGRLEEGYRRARLTLELDPSQTQANLSIARYYALTRQHDKCERELQKIADQHGLHHTPILVMRLRFGIWFGDIEPLRGMLDHITKSDDPLQQMMAAFCRYALGEGGDPTVLEMGRAYAERFGNVRLSALIGQLTTEGHAAAGNREAALRSLGETADGALADVAWLERCPLLDDLRDTPEYAAALAKVRNRASQIWELDRAASA
jgi:serine/threonine-protein kinase